MSLERALTSRPSIRPRSYSCYPVSSSKATNESFSTLLDSLDLPASLPDVLRTLREYLLGQVEEAEEGVRALKAFVEDSETDDGDVTAINAGGIADERSGLRRRRRYRAPSSERSSDISEDDALPLRNKDEVLTKLDHFVTTVTHFLAEVRADLPSLSSYYHKHSALPRPASIVNFQLSPEARISLDRFLEDHPLPSLPTLDLGDFRARIDDSRHSASSSAIAMISRLTTHLSHLQNLMSQLPTVSPAHGASAYLPAFPSLPSPPPLPPLPAIRSYFALESDRLAKAYYSSKDSLSSHIPSSATELTSLLTSSSSAALDEAARIYHLALEGGRKRLLRYEELPHEWRNNEYILSGYRFIPIESWQALLRSAFEYHNETVNIHSHFLGSLSILAFLFLRTNEPYKEAMDSAIEMLFVGAAMKCMLCSAAWHTLSGCATSKWFAGAACVDYVGISGLIAASVMGMEYWGFRCRHGLSYPYMCFSAALGITGMILPWRPWFNLREYKIWRISFFVGLALSALMPLAHMGVLYGFKETTWFFSPVMPSIAAYGAGLLFYANNIPERLAPGYWDSLLHSHQLWHFAIVIAVWAHWRALNIWTAKGSIGFSCAPGAH